MSEGSRTTRPIPRTSTELAAAAASVEHRVRPFLERLIRDSGFRRSLLEATSHRRSIEVREAGFDLTGNEVDALLERWSGQTPLGDDELGAVAGGIFDWIDAYVAKPASGRTKGLAFTLDGKGTD